MLTVNINFIFLPEISYSSFFTLCTCTSNNVQNNNNTTKPRSKGFNRNKVNQFKKNDNNFEKNDYYCLYEDCNCKKFESFQINLMKKKKVVTNIKFMNEDEVKDDSLAWNCLNRHKYNKTE